MKVTSVETLRVALPLDPPIESALGAVDRFGCIPIFLHTDEGVTGEGLVFTINDTRTAVLHEMIDGLAPLVVGTEVGHATDLWTRLWKAIHFMGHTGVTVVGLSGLDAAFWDLSAKAVGVPLYRLLGGARTAVPAYHSGGLWLTSSIDELTREAAGFVDQGFRAMKMRVAAHSFPAQVERVRHVRAAIGPDVRLMVDANQGLTQSGAIRLGRMLEEFDLAWFEEPLPAWDLDGVARVAAALDTPIASGETEYTLYGFRRMIELRSADVLMPDLQRVGGVTEFMRVAHMAAAYDIPVSSHLFPEMSLQILAALSNGSDLEYMPWFSSLYDEPFAWRDGDAVVPERPGWGFSINRDRIRHLAAR